MKLTVKRQLYIDSMQEFEYSINYIYMTRSRCKKR